MNGRKRYGPNDVIPCPSPSSLKRHLATAEYCPVCGTQGRRVPVASLRAIVLRRQQMRGAA